MNQSLGTTERTGATRKWLRAFGAKNTEMALKTDAGHWLDIDEIEAKADETRRQSNLAAPIDSFEIANQLGYTVRLASFLDPNLAGQVSNRTGSVVIDVAGYDSFERQRFTVAHEIGHALLHLETAKGVFVDDRETTLLRITAPHAVSTLPKADRREWQANAFAAALLMPRELVRTAADGPRSIKDLAQLFEVSQTAMRRRLKTLDIDRA